LFIIFFFVNRSIVGLNQISGVQLEKEKREKEINTREYIQLNATEKVHICFVQHSSFINIIAAIKPLMDRKEKSNLKPHGYQYILLLTMKIINRINEIFKTPMITLNIYNFKVVYFSHVRLTYLYNVQQISFFIILYFLLL